ncbi:MAG: hypothetical protein Q9220_005576 [cf. Caloplaca sp. 1 TL-2023]
MDIVTSIDFDSLDRSVDRPPPVPVKDGGIDISRQFDLYTTESITDSVDAPPIYQKDQPQDGSIASMNPRLPIGEPLKAFNPPKFILTSLARNHPSADSVYDGQQSDEVRRSIQHPRLKPESTPPSRVRAEIAPEVLPETAQSHNPVILCELNPANAEPRRNALMDYAQPDETMPGKMGMVKGASACSIRVTLGRKSQGGGESRLVRSIWVIANQGQTCIRQKLPQDHIVIPYTLWSNEVKVVIRHPSELRYYTDWQSDTPYKTSGTSWVNYTFQSATDSAAFQSALLSPLQLLKSLPTSRTMRLHPSPFIRAFSSRLQLCGLENLRVFRDALDPNSLVCMIHFSPNFRPSNGEEYIIFRLYPPPRNSVRIREDGEKCVKIKGLDIRGRPASEQPKKNKVPQSQMERLEEEAYGSRSIEKIKVEFDSGEEKRQFLELTRELQGLSSW